MNFDLPFVEPDQRLGSRRPVRYQFRHRFTMLGDNDGFAGSGDLIQQRQTFFFKFRGLYRFYGLDPLNMTNIVTMVK